MQDRFSRPNRKGLNLFLIILLTIGSVLAGLVALFYRAELNTFLLKARAQARNAISRQNDAIADKFDAIVGNLLFLSR